MARARTVAQAAARGAGEVERRLRHLRLKALWPRDLVVDRPPRVPPGWRTGPPDWIGVGVQKAGTSWWHQAINAHPQTQESPLPKELHFFDRGWHPEHPLDVAAYHALFPRPGGAVVGEWTPGYLPDAWFPPLVARAAPAARLLVMLRDPVARFESGVTHALAHGGPVRPIVAGDAERRGYYHHQLTALLRHVPRERLLVLQYEQCRDDPAPHLRATYRFLGLDDGFVPPGLDERVNLNPGPRYRLPAMLRAELVERYAADVAALAADFPEVDVGRWPSFADRP